MFCLVLNGFDMCWATIRICCFGFEVRKVKGCQETQEDRNGSPFFWAFWCAACCVQHAERERSKLQLEFFLYSSYLIVILCQYQAWQWDIVASQLYKILKVGPGPFQHNVFAANQKSQVHRNWNIGTAKMWYNLDDQLEKGRVRCETHRCNGSSSAFKHLNPKP